MSADVNCDDDRSQRMPRPGEPDEQVLARLRHGDIAALGTVFEQLGPRVYRIARHMLGNQADAEDVTHDIFLDLLARSDRFAGRSRFSSWLHRVTVNACLNRLKRRRRRTAAEAGGAEACLDDPSVTGERRETASRVSDALGRLSPDYRACVVLRELEGYSYAQIAELLEIPIGTVMSRLSRARRLLVAELRIGAPLASSRE